MGASRRGVAICKVFIRLRQWLQTVRGLVSINCLVKLGTRAAFLWCSRGDGPRGTRCRSLVLGCSEPGRVVKRLLPIRPPLRLRVLPN